MSVFWLLFPWECLCCGYVADVSVIHRLLSVGIFYLCVVCVFGVVYGVWVDVVSDLQCNVSIVCASVGSVRV